MENQKYYKAFISYSRTDEKFTKKLHSTLAGLYIREEVEKRKIRFNALIISIFFIISMSFIVSHFLLQSKELSDCIEREKSFLNEEIKYEQILKESNQ